ncbi:MAG: hypothetical protein JJD92_14890 [Frankiaceae bacterium]|nr:hypothetical protein [Frankiaceae bacterium]
MSSDEHDLIERLHAVAQAFEMPAAPLSDDVRRGRRRARRNRGLLVGAAAAAVAVVVGAAAAISGQDRPGSDGLEFVDPPRAVVGAVPVWYDARGLHHGDVVEKTPVAIGRRDGDRLQGALALVRSGALYLDPATGDVWFHPWGGHPRVVGRNSVAGPGGDPDGDTAAWFDGMDLVVYDTAVGREVSRTKQGEAVSALSGDHNPAGNYFVEVSRSRVAWYGPSLYSHDPGTGKTSVLTAPDDLFLLDVHGAVEVFRGREAVVLKAPGRAEARYPDLEPRARLSPSGNYVLSVEGSDAYHGAAIVDTRSGEVWRVPRNHYPWIAWSYGDIAMVDVDDELLACDAARRSCQALDAKRPFLMPTN